jgi:hypothetical protein
MRQLNAKRRKFAVTAALAVASLGFQIGCQNSGQRRMAAREPGLSASVDGAPSTTIAGSTTPVRSVTWVDRHPLFFKPRDMYEKTDNNPVVKTAAAAVIGVPSGILGELRQIVVGAPPAPRY